MHWRFRRRIGSDIVNGVRRRADSGSLGIGIALVLLAAEVLAAETGAEFFENKVRPLMAANCLACHSEASQVAMGGLRLDSRKNILAGGGRGPAVIPGDVSDSLLIRAVRRSDEALAMPPTGALSGSDLAILERWVEIGAPWGLADLGDAADGHTQWALVAPRKAAVPPVTNVDWVRTPVDAFVLNGIEGRGLRPAGPADKRTLMRRAYFDLVGLPPKPEEIASFLADESAGAFAQVVDRLLASPRYGERWGRHWLDVARYSDSNGVDENLVYKNAFRYRDYVIGAFNKDKPYDRFVTEQIAGDLLPAASDLETQFERWTATGFLSLGPKMLAEDDPVKMRMDIVDEQLDTLARAFMGLTVGCARCHDHKFDPIPTADYYALAGIFKSSKTMEHHKVVAEWHEYVLAPASDRKRLSDHLALVEAKRDEIANLEARHNESLVQEGWKRAGDYLLAADGVLRSRDIEIGPISPGASVASLPAGALVRPAADFDRGNVARRLVRGQKNAQSRHEGPLFAEFDVQLERGGDYQLDFLDLATGNGTADIKVNGSLMKRGVPAVNNRVASPDAGGWSVSGIFPFRTGKNTIRLEHKTRFPYFEALAVAPSRLPPSVARPTTEAQAARDYGLNPVFLAQWVERLARDRGAVASILHGWHAFRNGDPLDGWMSPAAPHIRASALGSREELARRYQQLFDEAVAQWRGLHPREASIDYTNERYKDGTDEPALPDPGLEEFRAFLYEKYGPFRPPRSFREFYPDEAQAELRRLDRERKALESRTPEFPRAMGVREGAEIGDVPIHVRGSHWTLGESVPRGFLSAIPVGSQPRIPEASSGRLQLAEWLVAPDHPLTARVMVNRLWRGHFGQGIVPTPDNFGRLGQKPSNQPLLDWLALEFVRGDWSIKRMHRLMMLSSTYRMSSAFDSKAAEVDPDNRLLWRSNRRRLEAEPLRDAIMYMAGDLDLTMGGSILDVRPRERVASTRAKSKLDYDRNRRAVYLPVVRSSLYDVFGAFEFADPSVLNGNRGEAVVAPQALFMMNGSIMLRHSRSMADRLLERADLDDPGRVQEAYERVLARPPSPSEIDRALTFVASVERSLAEREGDAGQRTARAWQSFCKAVIGSSEFLYVN